MLVLQVHQELGTLRTPQTETSGLGILKPREAGRDSEVTNLNPTTGRCRRSQPAFS